jgi:hypothetical protein
VIGGFRVVGVCFVGVRFIRTEHLLDMLQLLVELPVIAGRLFRFARSPPIVDASINA